MDYSIDSYLSSCPGNSAFESYSFLDDSAESYGGGSIPPSSYCMRATSDHNLKFSDHEKNSTTLTSGCLPYNVQSDLLSGEILSKDKLPNSFPMLQQLQNSGDLQNNFIVPGVVECNATLGTFHPQLDTPVHSELPHDFSRSIDGDGGEISAFLADVHAVSSAPTMCSTFPSVSSFMEPVKLEAFSFEGAENAAILSRTGNPNGSLSVIDNATLASLHDQNEFINGSLASIAAGQQTQLAKGGSKIQQQEFLSDVPTFISGTQMAFIEAQGTLIPPKMPPQIPDNKNECPISHSSDVQPHANSAHGNGASMKPRVRARRGQATDPHSIAERLRREKISDRMKNLQDLVPNSNKADKASMLDEIIDYVKFLQLQVKVLSMSRLGATGAVLPLLAESQTEGRSSLLLSAPTNGQGLLDLLDSEDSHSFEQEVTKLMETSITSAMQYLQNKGLCLMPIALASAISNQKGTAAAAIPPERWDAGSNCCEETIAEDGINGSALDYINCARELNPGHGS